MFPLLLTRPTKTSDVGEEVVPEHALVDDDEIILVDDDGEILLEDE